MARVSFEDPETAQRLNSWFVSIKVDREERPDLDSVYMAVCQAFTGSGGWPSGLFDHIGGGFCRYSTDERFLVPHFEKMLYDNALLILAYSEAYVVTKKKLYLAAAERTADFVLREMTAPEGKEWLLSLQRVA